MSGRTRFSEKALTKVVNAAAIAVPGVVTVNSSWTDLGTRSYPRCEIRTDQLAGVAQVSSFIAVSWPAPATDIAAQVQRNISTWVAAVTGLRCTQVNVTVEQAVAAEQRVDRDDLAAARDYPRLHPIRVSGPAPAVSPSTSPALPIQSPVTQTGPAPLSPSLPTARAVRGVDALPERHLRHVELPAAKALRTITAPRRRQVRGAQAPVALPVLPVPTPPLPPLRPVGAPATTSVPVALPRQRSLAPIYVRGVRFAPQAGERRRVR